MLDHYIPSQEVLEQIAKTLPKKIVHVVAMLGPRKAIFIKCSSEGTACTLVAYLQKRKIYSLPYNLNKFRKNRR